MVLVMMSYTERARRRGAMSFLDYEAEMIKLGFVECDERSHRGYLHEYTHPATGNRRYVMEAGQSYSNTLERLRDELEGARDAGSTATPA
jgi:hypothetical protein